ncbi:MAG: UvrD-helicase domain-containing protein [Ignavibacteria bacterium]|nr:UvrD-helicase domain-containing protein [Ignavibacteria bacterium]
MHVLTQQQLKALNLNIYTIVTANAGSGKTFILTRRFIDTILNKDIKFKEIAAITFTEKAASELVYKISNELDKILETIDPRHHKKLKEFREHILSAKISTIHSFCFDLLREFPIEAEIDPSTEIIDDLRKIELIEKSVEDTLIEFLDRDDQGVRDLLRMFGKENSIEFLKRLIEKRYFTDQLIEKIYLSNGQFDFQDYLKKIKQEAETYFKSIYEGKIRDALKLLPLIKNEITANKKQEILDGIDEIISSLNSFLNDYDFSKLQRIIGLICSIILTQKFEIRKSVFKNFDESSAVFQFQKIISEISDFYDKVDFSVNLEETRFNHIKSLIDIYNTAKKKFSEYKILEGVLDFEDLLILADKLLENEKVKKEISNRFKFILVDEFQDTDSIQFNIIKKITNDFDDEHNVFVVGDEKQSIYGFRNAQLSVFQNFKKEISDRYTQSGEKGVVTLSTSFRSTPSIASFVNEIFSRLFIQQTNSQINYHQEVEYSELQVGRETFSDENILFLVSKLDKDDKDNLFQSENVANYILDLVNSGKEIFDRQTQKTRKIEFGDIALLFRTNREMKSYENVFIKKGIPFVVSGGRGYFQSEEIRDWLNYLNFLANPKNDDSLIAILRSPFFSLSDNLILGLALENNRLSYFERLKIAANNNDNNLIKEVYSLLNHHIQIASRYSLPELLQRILIDTDYYGKIDGHPKKFQIIANIEKLINYAHSFISSGLEDLRTFSDYFKEAFEKEQTAEAVISEIRGSVQLMTMHQAKGLEFPIVILPNFENNLKRQSDRFGEISINDYFGFCFKIFNKELNESKEKDKGKNIHTLSSFFGTKINDGIDYNEQLRLLYVALTRATEKLVISFRHNFESNESDKTFSFKNILLSNLPPMNFNENNNLTIPTKLKFLKIENDNPVEFEQAFDLKIEVLKDLPVQTIETIGQSKNEISQQKNLIIQIDPIQTGFNNEIFTATQLNVYQFCPAKYLLKFIIGYNPHKTYLSEKIEDDEISGADFGLIFHQLMEKLNKADLKEAENILQEILLPYPESIRGKFKSEVLEKLKKLFDEDNFVNILNHQNSYREFEIKVKFKNHILLGIIDRLNLNDNEITIIDYKTDSFEEEDYNAKVREYLNQMEFYALISSIYFNTDKINLILYFINYPEKPFEKKFTQEELLQIKMKFEALLEKLNINKFELNENNCPKCEYSINSKCILKRTSS